MYFVLLVAAFTSLFFSGILSLGQTFLQPWFYENGIAFLFVAGIFILSIQQQKHSWHINFSEENKLPLFLLVIISTAYVVNGYFFKISILPPILFILATYALLGFFLEKIFWKRSIFVFLILILTLPLLERVQKFLGFPMRLVTAQLVSNIFYFLGIATVSDSTIIITENNATNIDLPCSGVQSIYTGALFMFAVYYLQKVKFSFKLIGISALFFLLLFFFNTWRVFSLIYIYGILEMKTAGDSIHVAMGIIGFAASCFALWWMTSRYISRESLPKTSISTKTENKDLLKIVVIILAVFSAIQWIVIGNTSTQTNNVVQKQYPFKLASIPLTEESFTTAEQHFFVTNNVTFSKKYNGKTSSGIPFTLLLVSSTSARTHHDPETCLQAFGNKIHSSEVIQLQNQRVRKLGLNDRTAEVYYWFAHKDKTILDYSERVWEETKSPGTLWTLVEVGFPQEVSFQDESIQQLFKEVDVSVRQVIVE